ncbi:MAG: response regulator [Desulfobacter sp.]|nr:response regulator [Desulfobacter sp.]WDP84727.1 MAG: response regulator [Desulfobacter sp.]
MTEPQQWSAKLFLLAGAWAVLLVLFGLGFWAFPQIPRWIFFYLCLGIHFIFLAGVFLAVKQRHTQTRRLHAQSLEFHSLVSQTRDLLWALDADLCITKKLGPGQDMTGYSAQELIGMPFARLLSEEAAKEFNGLARQNQPFSMETEICLPDGQVLAIEVSGTPGKGNFFCQGVIRNISEQKQRIRDTKAVEEKLGRAEKLKNLGLLAGSVAHDLNNILSGIATYPEVLLLDEHLDPKIRQGLIMIKDSGRKASSVVSDLLTISRGIKAEKQILNLNTLIERYMAAPEFHKITKTYAQVEIEVITEPELMNISGSYIHIEKAVMNLVLNAVEETAAQDRGRVTLSTANYYADHPIVHGQKKELPPGEYVMLTVADNGSGIPEDCLDKIFDPFFTQKEMGKSGTGLGLTVVLNAVQDHDGAVCVASDSQGTQFKLFFPAIRAELPKIDIPGSVEEIKGQGETLLIVDDLPSQRKIAATILKNLGYKVFSVADGLAATEFVKKTPVDLLILDMIMDPFISGLETYERIKRIYPDQKAIIASGHSESQDVLKAQKLGAGCFVKKPYTILDMGIAVKEELEN